MSTKIGVYCSSISPELWQGLYSSLCACSVRFELMFVGPIKPDFLMPSNMKFIESSVKPAQCYFIGANEVAGDYILNVADDMSFSLGALDDLLKVAESSSSNTIVTARFGKHAMGFYGTTDDCLLPVGGLMRRELWDSIGIDKNFIALYWDVDMAMENYARGGKVVVCEEATAMDDRSIPDRAGLCNYRDGVDRNFWYAMWTPTGLRTRVQPIDPLVNSPDIRTVSQGNTGPWT